SRGYLYAVATTFLGLGAMSLIAPMVLTPLVEVAMPTPVAVMVNKTHVEFIELLEMCAWRYRQGEMHCVVDNASYHSTPEVKAWLADHPRFVLDRVLVLDPHIAYWNSQAHPFNWAYGEDLIHDQERIAS